MNIFLELLDNVLGRHKNITMLLGVMILFYFAVELYNIKLTVRLHTDFIEQNRRNIIIKEAEELALNPKNVKDIDIYIASQYCDSMDKLTGLVEKSCTIVYNYINKVVFE